MKQHPIPPQSKGRRTDEFVFQLVLLRDGFRDNERQPSEPSRATIGADLADDGERTEPGSDPDPGAELGGTSRRSDREKGRRR